MLPPTDDIELDPEQVTSLVARAAENFAYAERPEAFAGSRGEATLQLASYRPDEVRPSAFCPQYHRHSQTDRRRRSLPRDPGRQRRDKGHYRRQDVTR